MTRVLVVEDEESFSDALSYMLRKEGFEVAVAATGPDALTEFDHSGADFVLLDLMLPGLSGTEVCRQIRSKSSVPIIMVTARDSEIDKVVGLEIGADDYVTKPYYSARARRPHKGSAAPPVGAGGAQTRRAGGRAGTNGRGQTHSLRRRRLGFRCLSRNSSCLRCCSATPAGS